MTSAEDRDSRYAPEAEALSLRCLLFLEQLLPVERAAFLLHHVFGRSRSETARLVGVSEETCQRLILRVRRVMRTAKPTIEAERKERQHVTARFLAAVRKGDVHLLAELLAPDAMAYADAAQPPAVGRRAVARLLGHLGDELTANRIEMSLEIAEGLVQTVRCTSRTRLPQ
jgi:RNA polymerase sigma-70 factor (ECF subfamily)